MLSTTALSIRSLQWRRKGVCQEHETKPSVDLIKSDAPLWGVACNPGTLHHKLHMWSRSRYIYKDIESPKKTETTRKSWDLLYTGQWMEERWKQHQNFADVCRRLPSTSCEGLLKKILYTDLQHI
ncbi:hypothetical protein PR048_029928 [Dryococelus australis]|uniref:Uncharacterized protein n=1 Tax=Dryococelus australis TaxID=614101 RepID=A0ABQ9G8D9_9NEOP|nr:hypothetical protein PR048_029928 [Dryococelus australis]